MTELLDKYDESGDSYEPLRNAYLVLTGEMGSMVNSASRFIGGVYRERAMIDQPGATQPFTPVRSPCSGWCWHTFCTPPCSRG
jgi:hypothetical protein